MGYYRDDLPAPIGGGQLPTDSFTSDLQAGPHELVLGMGDNFAPEMGASLLRIPTSTADACLDGPHQRLLSDQNHIRVLADLYKTDSVTYPHAYCDNVAAFLMRAGYRAIVPGKEDFIYGSLWLSRLARQFRAEANSDARYANKERALSFLAANLNVSFGSAKGKAAPPVVGGGHACMLLFGDETWKPQCPEKRSKLKDIGYTITGLSGGRTLIIGVIGQETLDQVSEQNKSFCASPPPGTSVRAKATVIWVFEECAKGNEASKVQVSISDPLAAVIDAMKEALGDEPFDHVVVMAQMSRGSAEELAAELVAARKADPSIPKVDIIMSAASANQFSGNFTLNSQGELSLTPVLTPHPAYDSQSYNHSTFPLVHPLSEVILDQRVGYTLRSAANTDNLPNPANHTTSSLLWKEVASVNPLDPAANQITRASQDCDVSAVGQRSNLIDQCNVEAIQYLLRQMLGIRPGSTDIAILERRDFFLGVLPDIYATYDVCSWASDEKVCRLNVALDRILWKGDFVERAMISGSDLSTMITTSKANSVQSKPLASPSSSGTWLTTFGIVSPSPPPPSDTDEPNQTASSFAIPEDANCVRSPSAPGNTYCVASNPIQSDADYWVITSDHLATDTTTYTNIASIPNNYRNMLPDRTGNYEYLTSALAQSIVNAHSLRMVDIVRPRAVLSQRELDIFESGEQPIELGDRAEIANQQLRHFQIDFAKIFFGYIASNSLGGDQYGDQYIANNFQGVSDSRATTVSQHELDVEGQLRALWEWGYLYAPDGPDNPRFAHHFGFGLQSDAEYDRAAQGNLTGAPSNASYSANNFAIGPLLQWGYPIHYFSNYGVMKLARFAVTVSPLYQQQLRGTNLYVPFSVGTSELTIPVASTFGWNFRQGVRLEAAAPAKWYQLSELSYLEFGPEESGQHRVLSGVTLTNTPLSQQITCTATSTTTIISCINSAVKTHKTLTVDENTKVTATNYGNQPADGLYWDIHMIRKLPNFKDQMLTWSFTIDSKGDAFLRRGSGIVLSTQTLYAIPLNFAVNIQILPNLAFAPSANFFFYRNQLAEQSLVIHGFTGTLRWYYDRDSRVPFVRQLLFKGPAAGDLTKQTKMKQGQ